MLKEVLMKVLMFGWEFPPFSSGGLGTACKGLTKGMSDKDIDILFVVPKGENSRSRRFTIIPTEQFRGTFAVREVNTILRPYMTEESYSMHHRQNVSNSIYGSNLHHEVWRYSDIASRIARKNNFDVIHAHDWMTYQAGINAKNVSKKPLIVHVHATEFDRTGGNGLNQYVYDIERKGFHESDRIIAVSEFTKNKIVQHYGISPDKISVVHNAVEFTCPIDGPKSKLSENDKIVLFLGRITLQKGPDYFVETAKKVLEKEPNVKFIVAGSGDMEGKMIEKVAESGIGKSVLFTGFLTGEDIDRAYRLADVYVMPSVSEPFGITPLEAMRNGTPVIISKQSGVSEVINHCFKSDFWDTHKMADQILGIIRYKPLAKEMSENGLKEVKKFDWKVPASKCVDIYADVISELGGKKKHRQLIVKKSVSISISKSPVKKNKVTKAKKRVVHSKQNKLKTSKKKILKKHRPVHKQKSHTKKHKIVHRNKSHSKKKTIRKHRKKK